MSTPKGRSVNSRVARMRSRMNSGLSGLPPMTPRPPASDTAATSLGGVVEPRLSQPMPAWMIGCSMPSTSHKAVFSFVMPRSGRCLDVPNPLTRTGLQCQWRPRHGVVDSRNQPC